MSPVLPRVALLGILVAPLFASACAPQTVIRRSAFIPGAAAPARTGGELAKGEVRLAGHLNAIRASDGVVDIDDLFTEVGDPGVFIPDFQVGASAYFGAAPGLELGGQVSYASLSWASRNTVGVLEFPPGHDENLFQFGVGLRYNVPIEHPSLRLGFIGELNFVDVPEAIFVLNGGAYEFRRVDHENFMLPNVALQLGWEGWFENGSVLPYLLLGVQRSVTNVGFDDQLINLDDNTLEGFLAGYVGLGADLRIEGFVLGMTFYVPFESVERIDFGPSFAVTVGGVID
ncbi:MAG: hypothetical protein CVU56_07445 [Deltaproteobacteria bacterium HGW-Deltaproteobacteria-14]|jgi:hypothetical protein|nr:MAG: hypothetical protein CVU56_07445 [Deltaproteobacteria bacterium HGW-Deltaproteobacteria-14]